MMIIIELLLFSRRQVRLCCYLRFGWGQTDRQIERKESSPSIRTRPPQPEPGLSSPDPHHHYSPPSLPLSLFLSRVDRFDSLFCLAISLLFSTNSSFHFFNDYYFGVCIVLLLLFSCSCSFVLAVFAFSVVPASALSLSLSLFLSLSFRHSTNLATAPAHSYFEPLPTTTSSSLDLSRVCLPIQPLTAYTSAEDLVPACLSLVGPPFYRPLYNFTFASDLKMYPVASSLVPVTYLAESITPDLRASDMVAVSY
ncbi:hypothetical protein BJY04DRAFT_173767 [Aspergillus karnatakaensis]|uniref:uncharacterized protein n=1 Tax=Aspergillus karnatakaensis TaxID=1810916 RepID=UPI003CCE2382